MSCHARLSREPMKEGWRYGHMGKQVMRGFLLAAGLALAGCTELSSMTNPSGIDKKAAELKEETTTVGVVLPEGCLASKPTLSAGQATVTVSYREPNTNERGEPLRELAFTTIYFTTDKTKPTAIRVWTNDPHGGSPVTIRDIPVPGSTFSLCVTAWNWGRKESLPAMVPAVETPL